MAENKSMTAFAGGGVATLLVEKLKSLKVEKINNKKEITIQPFNHSTVKLRKKCAFTLAEVLITLGIIGVVAALTIPTLISNYQKRSYVSALQKSYANLQNGFKLMAATEGVDYLCQTTLWKDMKKDMYGDDYVLFAESAGKNLSKYLKIADTGIVGEEGKLQNIVYNPLGANATCCTFESEGFPYIQFQDGSVIYGDSIIFRDDVINNVRMYIYLDVNGISGPNQWGRDLFMLLLEDFNGMRLMPYYQYNYSDDYKVIPYSKYDDKYCGEIGSTDVSDAGGNDCLDRIIEEGWKMNY